MDTCNLSVEQPEVAVSQQAVVLVDDTIDADFSTVSPVVQAYSEEYVLTSGGMYGSNGLVGAVPKWILDAVQQQLTTGDGNLMTVLTDLQTLMASFQAGVNQQISSLNTDMYSQNGIVTTIASQVDDNRAEAIDMIATKVDSTSAQVIATQAINTRFADEFGGISAEAFIGQIANTYVDVDSAIAQEVALIAANVGDVSASVSDISSATVEQVENPLWVDDGNGTDPDTNGEPRYVLQAKAKKQLSVDANGVVTGLILESGATSSFTVQADEFKMVASGQSVASREPFSVNATTGDITFNGKVSFDSVQGVIDTINNGNTTTIDGGKIATGSITSNQIQANSIGTDQLAVGTGIVNGYMQSSDFNLANVTGFRLKSNAAGTFADPTIYGATIRAGSLYSTLFDLSAMQVISGNNANYSGSLFPSYLSSTTGGSAAYLEIISDYFYGTTYSFGYLKNRIASASTMFIIQIIGSANQGSTAIQNPVSLYYSIDDNAWEQYGSASLGSLFVSLSLSLTTQKVRFKAVLAVGAGVARSLSLSVQAPATI